MKFKSVEDIFIPPMDRNQRLNNVTVIKFGGLDARDAIVITADGKPFVIRGRYGLKGEHLSVVSLRKLAAVGLIDSSEIGAYKARKKVRDANAHREWDRDKFLEIAKRYGIAVPSTQRHKFKETAK